MTSKEKIINFMKEKKKKLEECDINGNLYFNDKDKQLIEQWSEEKCEEIMDYIYHYAFSTEENEGLTEYTCPFCINQNEQCKICNYALNHHGHCRQEKSDFQAILTRLQFTDDEIFTNLWYRETLSKL